MADRNLIYCFIDEERRRQDAKWGADRRLPEYTYATVLGEEYGEVCRAALEHDADNLVSELVQTAAVCVAWLEQIQRVGD